MCDDVVKLKLDYYDTRDKLWREEWVTTSLDGQPDRLPSKIRITLTVHDERGKEVPFQTEVRVAMPEPLNNQPQEPGGHRRRAAAGADAAASGTTASGTADGADGGPRQPSLTQPMHGGSSR